MTDRELLEKAAKAVNGGSWHPLTHAKPWNPLTDDGDALRLAVKLKIPLQFPDWQDIAKTWGPDSDGKGFVEPAIQHNGDLGAATRLAITRAAAAIGEGKSHG